MAKLNRRGFNSALLMGAAGARSLFGLLPAGCKQTKFDVPNTTSSGAPSGTAATNASAARGQNSTQAGTAPATGGSMSTQSSMPEPQVLLSGLAIGESPRWHSDRLWLCNWGTQQIVAVDLHGKSEVMARVPTTIPFSIDWLPDGRLLVVSGPEAQLLRREPDGSLVIHADLSSLAGGLNEIVVDGRGNIYVNGSVRDSRRAGDHQGQEPGRPEEIDETLFQRLAESKPGIIVLVTLDGRVRQVADGISFPNGMVVTPDNSKLIIADSLSNLTA